MTVTPVEQHWYTDIFRSVLWSIGKGILKVLDGFFNILDQIWRYEFFNNEYVDKVFQGAIIVACSWLALKVIIELILNFIVRNEGKETPISVYKGIVLAIVMMFLIPTLFQFGHDFATSLTDAVISISGMDNGADAEIQMIVDSNVYINNTYDELGRMTEENINNNIYYKYLYLSNGNKTSYILHKVIIDNNDEYEFKYDDDYNIKEIYLNKSIINKYNYNELNELISEIDYISEIKIKYYYDGNGNILCKKKFKLDGSFLSKDTFEYSEIWKDQLVKFNNNNNITYNQLGNPTTFGNKTYSWIDGSKLKSFTNGNVNITYEYDYLDKLIKKIKNNQTTEYYYDKTNLVIEKRNNNVLYYIYNSNNNLIGFKYNNSLYFYQKKSI